MPTGRPTTYTAEMGELICEALASGESLRSICARTEDGFPPQSVVFQWLHRQPSFAENYARARAFWAEAEFERMCEIADTPQLGEIRTDKSDGTSEIRKEDMLGHRRLQVDTRKWFLARMNPRKFGDALSLKHGDPDGNVLRVEVTRVQGKT